MSPVEAFREAEPSVSVFILSPLKSRIFSKNLSDFFSSPNLSTVDCHCVCTGFGKSAFFVSEIIFSRCFDTSFTAIIFFPP